MRAEANVLNTLQLAEQQYNSSFSELKKSVCLGERLIPTDASERQALTDSLMIGLITVEWLNWLNKPTEVQQIRIRTAIEESLSLGTAYQLRPNDVLQKVCGKEPAAPIKKNQFAKVLGITLGSERIDTPDGYSPARARGIIVQTYFHTRCNKDFHLAVLDQSCFDQGFVPLIDEVTQQLFACSVNTVIAKLIVILGPKPLSYLPRTILPKINGGIEAVSVISPFLIAKIHQSEIQKKSKPLRLAEIPIAKDLVEAEEEKIKLELGLTPNYEWLKMARAQKNRLWQYIADGKKEAETYTYETDPENRTITTAKAAISIITQANKNLAFNLAIKKVLARHGRLIDYLVDELTQVTLTSLYRHLEGFDPARGVQFSTYIYNWMIPVIDRAYNQLCDNFTTSNSMRQKTRSLQIAVTRLIPELERQPTIEEIAAATEYSVPEVKEIIAYSQQETNVISLDSDVYFRNENSDQPLSRHERTAERSEDNPVEEKVFEQNANQILRQIISQSGLTVYEKEVLYMRYLCDMTLEEIGTRFTRTREAIRQTEAKALWKMRSTTKTMGMNAFDLL